MNKHTCYNCRLQILDGEEEIAVEGKELKQLQDRCKKAGLRRNDLMDTNRRYRHKSYEICGQREAAEVEWHYWNGPDSNGD